MTDTLLDAISHPNAPEVTSGYEVVLEEGVLIVSGYVGYAGGNILTRTQFGSYFGNNAIVCTVSQGVSCAKLLGGPGVEETWRDFIQDMLTMHDIDLSGVARPISWPK